MTRQISRNEVECKQLAEEALDLARDYLGDQRVRRALGGLGRELFQLAMFAEVPDVVDGRIVEFEDYLDTDTIPIIVGEDGESIYFSMDDWGPVQRRRYEGLAWRLGMPDVDDGTMADPTELYTDTFGETADGMTEGVFQALLHPAYRDFLASDRPRIGLRWQGTVQDMAFVAIHELSHARDALRWPLRKDVTEEDAALETELRAYTVHGIVSHAITGSVYRDDIARIEAIRARYNGPLGTPMAFRAAPEIKAALDEDDLAHIYQR